MSEVNHPNIHAIGFMMDIIRSLEERVRGEARNQGKAKVFDLVNQKIQDFVNEIEEILDENFNTVSLPK